MKLDDISFNLLETTISSLEYRFFTSGDYNLNLVGIRTRDTESNSFNDFLSVLFLISGHRHCFSFPITTDPGIFYRLNPLNVLGTAIMRPGQYRGLWKIGRHQGLYTALVQSKPVTVYRDNNKDNKLDKTSPKTGMFGINCHRANPVLTSKQVDRWSAGCQVFSNPKDFAILIALCQRSIEEYGNSFTYTLLTEDDL